MEETIIEIPETSGESWEPPAITRVQKTGKSTSLQSCADVFFAQYAVCVLLVTAIFVIKLYDASLCESMLSRFREQIGAPTEDWVNRLMVFLSDYWK